MHPLLGFLIAGAALFALGNSASPDRPDFSQVTSKAIAKEMAARGRLVRVALFPTELGGPDVPENEIYLPPAVISSRAMIIGTLDRFAGDGLITDLKVTPDYKGASLVPSRIFFRATGKKKGGFTAELEVW